MRNLVVVLGDQLDAESSAFDGFDRSTDAVWMAECQAEGEHVWSHKARIALFLTAMRHFRDTLRQLDLPVHFQQLDGETAEPSLGAALLAALGTLQPERVIVTMPGEHRVREELTEAAASAGVKLEVRPDHHFLCGLEEFAEYVRGSKQLRMETFYRRMRRARGVLMEGDQPLGERWNYDPENRGSFGREGPGALRPPRGFAPDGTTREVLALVQDRFPGHPGSLARFAWPVTPDQAAEALEDFIDHRLPLFGLRQDAMWSGEPYLYHSRLSAAMNLKLIHPAEVIRRVCEALEEGRAPLPAVEGFVRQILGWREYVRGIYWQFMPDYADSNHFGAEAPLPGFYWSGDTEMACLREVISQTLEYGYAHHIQRLMITGLFALLLGVRPQEAHRWYLAAYVDAVEWVELPDTLGMSQFADGGLMASKPYAASGKYIQRMSNYCASCPFDPSDTVGEAACPYTTLYWDFLLRHSALLERTPRAIPQARSAQRWVASDRQAIARRAQRIREQCLA